MGVFGSSKLNCELGIVNSEGGSRAESLLYWVWLGRGSTRRSVVVFGVVAMEVALRMSAVPVEEVGFGSEDDRLQFVLFT